MTKIVRGVSLEPRLSMTKDFVRAAVSRFVRLSRQLEPKKSVATVDVQTEQALFAAAARAARARHIAAGHKVSAWNEDGEQIGYYGPDGEVQPLTNV